MRILIFQMQASSPLRASPRFSQWLGVLAAVLRKDGHELSLSAFSRYQAPELHEAICRFRPQVIYVEADRFAADETRHAVEFVARRHSLPVILGGPYAVAQPDAALSIPGVMAVVIGEPETAVRQLLWALERGEDHERTAGVWTNPPDGPPIKNEPSPLAADLDQLPPADREIFHYEQHVGRTHTAELSVGRGCPYRCAHCLNDWLAELCVPGEAWVRRRSPENVCDEIDALCERYPQIERIRFIDHIFALDGDWLARFAACYAERCGLPFSCHLRANAARSRTVRLLARAGCDHATVDVINGSDFIRNDIFELGVSDRQIERTFRLLDSAGISATAFNLLGSPYETQVTVDRTAKLMERVAPPRVHTRLYVPMPGTRAEELCRECGWLSGLGERAFRENAPMLRMPSMSAEVIRGLFDQFNWQARHPRSARLMRFLSRVPIGGGKSLYDVLVRHPASNGRLFPSDPRAVQVEEHDGVMIP